MMNTKGRMSSPMRPQVTQGNVQANQGNVAIFVRKLWKMCNNPKVTKILSWNDNGTSFIIHDQVAFITVILPMYFKHSNMGSFVRQLNLYDFHKVCMDRHAILEYQNMFFRKKEPEMLSHIKRKLPQYKRVTKDNNESCTCDNNAKTKEKLADLTSELVAMEAQHHKALARISSLEEEQRLLMKEVKSLHRTCDNQSLMLQNIVELLIPFIKTYERNRRKAESTGAAGFLEVDPCILEKLEEIKRTEMENSVKTEDAAGQKKHLVQLYKPSSLQPLNPVASSTVGNGCGEQEMPLFGAVDPAFGGISQSAQYLPNDHSYVQVKLGSPDDDYDNMSEDELWSGFQVDNNSCSDSYCQPQVTSPTDTGTTTDATDWDPSDQIMDEEFPGSDCEDTKSDLVYLNSLIESGALDGILEDCD